LDVVVGARLAMVGEHTNFELRRVRDGNGGFAQCIRWFAEEFKMLWVSFVDLKKRECMISSIGGEEILLVPLSQHQKWIED